MERNKNTTPGYSFTAIRQQVHPRRGSKVEWDNKKEGSHMSAFKYTMMGAGLAGFMMLGNAAHANQQATVIISQSCDYMLLNSSKGMVLVKQLDGITPQEGDTLLGEFTAGDFSNLQNNRNKDSMQVWVDTVDPHSSKALSQYGRYCT